jgi:hypothetical protein
MSGLTPTTSTLVKVRLRGVPSCGEPVTVPWSAQPASNTAPTSSSAGQEKKVVDRRGTSFTRKLLLV